MIRVQKLKFQTVEELAYTTLHEFEQEVNQSLSPPVDVDLVGECLYGLRWDWDVMDERALPKSAFGEATSATQRRMIILAGLYPHERRVVLNESHRDLFDAKPGLERFTKAHEIGHWVLHIDKAALDHPKLFDYEADCIICRDGDDTWIERQANWYAAALLMPRQLFKQVAQEHDLLKWKSLYRLAEHFGVTISALCIRMKQCGMSYVDEQGRIHKSIADYVGQETL